MLSIAGYSLPCPLAKSVSRATASAFYQNPVASNVYETWSNNVIASIQNPFRGSGSQKDPRTVALWAANPVVPSNPRSVAVDTVLSSTMTRANPT